MLPRPDWSRPLPRPLVIPDVMTPRTLADVRTLIGHLPKETHAKSAWQHVEGRAQEGHGGRATWHKLENGLEAE
ncbi:MAG TPA: hypothetical protein VGJ20_40270 [Xanthobacteraceae bacterium]|jgi:hypothetical protein